jgi:cyclic pyranopterin phosphate synthase
MVTNMGLTHVDDSGITMVDISSKKPSVRTAIARGSITLREETISLIASSGIGKGDVLTTAQVAGIMAAKNTSALIPLCHQLPLNQVAIEFEVGKGSISATCTVRTTYSTGVEMEALVGVSAALLTVWDMVKANEKDGSGQYPATAITNIHVVRKEK